MNSVATVSAIPHETSDAALPATYEAARRAIAECERIDECKSWSDKAAALASYAKQAKDDSLRVMAVRIQARAERRCGELLKQIPRADEATRYGQEGALPPVTRTLTATAAGLSEHQRKTALRLASIPERTFNGQVESPKPPSVTQLASLGTARRPGISRMPRINSRAFETVAQFARFCQSHSAADLALSIDPADVESIREHLGTAECWLREFADAMCGLDG